MIVRGAILSDKRVLLDSGQSERAPPERGRYQPIRAVTTTRESNPDSAKPIESTSVPRVVAPAPLTLGAVSQWIAGQDEVTRSALATQLAERIDELRRAALEQGYEEGRRSGQAEAEATASRSLELLAEINRGAQAMFEARQAELAERCAEIVVTALNRIAGPLLRTPEAALGAVLEVLKRITEEGEVVVRVSAADLPILRASEDRLATALTGRKFSLIADKRVAGGGAIVESALGSLDGRLEVQLRGLADTVVGASTGGGGQP
jgi:flagellar assembly protein FliH